MARSTTVISTIHAVNKSSESVTINSAWSGADNGTITLSASVPSTVDIGDLITDNAGNSYVITGISGSDLTAQDWDSTADPATGVGASIANAYHTNFGNWETDLDNTTRYASGDTVIGHCYDDGGDFTGGSDVTINQGSTPGLSVVTLTVPSGERHDGTAAGGGVETSKRVGSLSPSGIESNIEWMKVTKSGGSWAGGLLFCDQPGGGADSFVRNGLAFHGVTGSTSTYGCQVVAGSTSTAGHFINCGAWRLDQTGGGSRFMRAFGGAAGGRASRMDNCTAHNITASGTSTSSTNCYQSGGSQTRCRNCIGTSADDDDFATATTFQSGTTTNLSEDTTKPGTSGQEDTPANLYISTSLGIENLQLADTSSNAYGNGTDLVDTPPDVGIDIAGFDRDADTTYDPWDIGFSERQETAGAAVTNLLPLLGVG